jgi:hypothetical protein
MAYTSFFMLAISAGCYYSLSDYLAAFPSFSLDWHYSHCRF